MAERLMIFLQSCLGNKMDNRFIGSEIMGHRFNRSFNLVLINSCFKSDIAYSLVKILLGYRYFFTPSYLDRKSTRLNSSHVAISYAVFCLKKKKKKHKRNKREQTDHFKHSRW